MPNRKSRKDRIPSRYFCVLTVLTAEWRHHWHKFLAKQFSPNSKNPPPTHCLFKHNSVMSSVFPNTPHRRRIYSNHFISHIGPNFQIHIYMGKCGNPATRGCCYYCYYLFLISFITYGVSQFIIVLPLHLLSHCMFNTPPPLFIHHRGNQNDYVFVN